MPRPTKLTPDLHTAITQAVALGVPLISAGEFAGVAKPTLLEWVSRGEGRHQRPATKLYADFADALARARAQDEVRRLMRLEQAGRGGAILARKTTRHLDGSVTTEERFAPPDWQADAWVLARSRPETWGNTARIDMRLQIQKAAEVVAKELDITPEALLEEAQRILYKMDHGDDA